MLCPCFLILSTIPLEIAEHNAAAEMRVRACLGNRLDEKCKSL
jgi:hypothetical protein